ncbi:very long chain fatty acid elongase F-like [Drosophila bipectinata]|uniref:very long chain fatty acid elongase F-like n=1 Tax=Drosophila bipectinata TaxID=42026 RepID=UPI001C8ABA6F|nr:elongation of very long chain fatty acids protein F-like [Drosophila bipectinata]
MIGLVDPHIHPIWATPWPTATILVAYFAFVLKLGPDFMKNRKPYDLRGIIKAYNIIQIIYNAVSLYLATRFLFFWDTYDLSCVTTLPMDHPHKDYERFICNIYGFNKFMDLTETIFFVLRKKDKQITFLHLFHHSFMASIGYFLLTYHGYGGLLFPACTLNAFVHVMMYIYYYLSSVNPSVQRSIWWKKYITLSQLVQFVTVEVLVIKTLLHPNCNYSKLMMWVCLIVNPIFIGLFSHFYIKNYVLSPKKSSKPPQDSSDSKAQEKVN